MSATFQRTLARPPLMAVTWLALTFVLLFSSSLMAAVDRSQTDWRVAEIYVATLGYAPDNDGLQYWVQNIRTNSAWTPTTVAQSFFDQPLVQAMYPPGQGYETLIEALYQNIFGRAADAAGKSYWLAQLQSGAIQRNQMIIALIEGGWANLDAIADMARFGNQIEASLAFAAHQSDNGIHYNQLNATDQERLRDAGAQLLSGITADTATRDAAIATIPTLLQGFQSGNRAPLAASISRVADEGIVYVEVQLSASDPDHDQITYHLISPRSGTGYTEAYVGAQSGRLYVTLDGSGAALNLSYDATDGIQYSAPATVALQIVPGSEDKGTGAEEVDAQTYASFDIVSPWGNLLGAPGSAPSVPRAVDLSASFPVPGDQGQQGSCVGWATAYAIKSYFEKRDLDWDLSRREHIFSPAFVFNAIALPGCNGSYPDQALDRLRNVGAATWDQMPYTDQECSTQPNTQAASQAGGFKIQSWGTLRTVDDMKSQIANRRPVLLIIQVYPPFQSLRGDNSVYNDFSGNSVGYHALAIVGYDDDRFGGAFRVINSWSTGWGDGGFFWFPYSAVSNSSVFAGAYSVEDISNTEDPVDPVDPVPPPPSNDLPNLEILDWTANYDPRPGGAGSLQFEIVNSGTATAPAGAYVNLMLSEDTQIGGDDVFVIYEPIPFPLDSGVTAYRDAANALRFYIPDTLPPGTYQMALWVDDLDDVVESNENDNISFGDRVQIENTLPDLAVQTWYAEWSNGSGSFTYEVINQGRGTAPGGWDVNLMLSEDDILDSGDLYLAYETSHSALAPGEYVYRDDSSPLYFDVSNVPPGYYQMAVWVDDLEAIAESNERNNESWGWDYVEFGGFAGAQPAGAAATDQPTQARYNGQRTPRPPRDASMAQVEIRATPDGRRELLMLNPANGPGQATGEVILTKANTAKNRRGFPVEQRRPMPDRP